VGCWSLAKDQSINQSLVVGCWSLAKDQRPKTNDGNQCLLFSASDSNITGAGPEIPPSLRTRQKCTIMNTLAITGIAMQCQMYARSRALASTIEPPSNPKRTSLYGVMPNCGPNGPSCPSSGVARAMFVPTVTAQNPSWSSGSRYPVNDSSSVSVSK